MIFFIERTLVAYKHELVETKKLASSMKSEVEANESLRSDLRVKVDIVGLSMKNSLDEIARLEGLVSLEKQKLQQYTIEKLSLDELLAASIIAENVKLYILLFCLKFLLPFFIFYNYGISLGLKSEVQ